MRGGRRRLRFLSGGTRRAGARGGHYSGRGSDGSARQSRAPGRACPHGRRLTMQAHADPLRVALQVGLYIFFFALFLWLFALSPVPTLIGTWMASALGTCIAAVATNVVTLRIY